MTPTVLIYGISDQKKLTAIEITAVRMGLILRRVKPEETDLSIGFLAGMDGFTDEKPAPEPDFDEEMLVMCGLSNAEINELLDTLREKNVNIPLKAMATDTNVKWSLAYLHKELSAEREAFRAMAAKAQPPRHGVHRKRK